jgi:hypothetical protein
MFKVIESDVEDDYHNMVVIFQQGRIFYVTLKD